MSALAVVVQQVKLRLKEGCAEHKDEPCKYHILKARLCEVVSEQNYNLALNIFLHNSI